eukprot:7387979-Prymnesium_polylepis.1
MALQETLAEPLHESVRNAAARAAEQEEAKGKGKGVSLTQTPWGKDVTDSMADFEAAERTAEEKEGGTQGGESGEGLRNGSKGRCSEGHRRLGDRGSVRAQSVAQRDGAQIPHEGEPRGCGCGLGDSGGAAGGVGHARGRGRTCSSGEGAVDKGEEAGDGDGDGEGGREEEEAGRRLERRGERRRGERRRGAVHCADDGEGDEESGEEGDEGGEQDEEGGEEEEEEEENLHEVKCIHAQK